MLRRVVAGWNAVDVVVLEKVYHRNAEALFARFKGGGSN